MPIMTYQSKKEVTCKPKACPTCGSTECFERPRYFSGQLLTDRDLDAAQRYVIEKNRLHNRYLVGSGVVCGLAVRCDRCDTGSVVVRSGYAIDCCGNDIVLCANETFSVADYLAACRKKKDHCDEKISYPSKCDELEREYYLVLNYSEEPGRPITALMRGDGCATRCEPSRTKETFRLDLIAAEDLHHKKAPNLIDKIRGCTKEVSQAVIGFATDLQNIAPMVPSQAHTAFMTLFCKMRDYILKVYKAGANVRCTLACQLREIEESLPTSPTDPEYNKKMYGGVFKLFGYVYQYLIDCVCDAVLVPCSSCECDQGVILACLTVKNDKVIKICNLCRTQVLTGPAIRYWFGPLFKGVGSMLERLCCELDVVGLFGNRFKQYGDDRPEPITGAGLTSFTPGSYTGYNEYTVDAAAQRGNMFVEMIDAFTTKGFGDMVAEEGGFPFLNPDTLTAMDIYHKHASEAQAILAANNVAYAPRHARDDDEAYSIMNLGRMAWAIPSGSSVEVLLNSRNEVTAVQLRSEERPR